MGRDTIYGVLDGVVVVLASGEVVSLAAVDEASAEGTIEGAATMMTVLVLVEERPFWSVTTLLVSSMMLLILRVRRRPLD